MCVYYWYKRSSRVTYLKRLPSLIYCTLTKSGSLPRPNLPHILAAATHLAAPEPRVPITLSGDFSEPRRQLASTNRTNSVRPKPDGHSFVGGVFWPSVQLHLSHPALVASRGYHAPFSFSFVPCRSILLRTGSEDPPKQGASAFRCRFTIRVTVGQSTMLVMPRLQQRAVEQRIPP